jgi:electron transfer flavoprotein beta subunit
MNIIVCAKQVLDIAELKMDSESNKPILQGLDSKVNEIDKNAVEEALKIKEKLGGKITVITVSEQDAKERMKEILAMGADEAIIISSSKEIDYAGIASLLSAAINKIGAFDIILCGEASTDMFSGQVGPRLAGMLSIPQITYVQSIDAEKDVIKAERNLGDKVISMQSSYPILLSVTKEINEPRLPSLMQILAAANKPIQEWSENDFSISLEPKVKKIDLQGVSMERKNIIYKDDSDESIQQLVDNLTKEGVLR